ncbi:MAG: hypothetical protein V8T08_05980 [Monoglobus pectinilyticus]
MNDTIKICLGIIIPLVGTSLGAAMVFFLKDKMQPMLQKVLLGFASGVMIAASVWSLIIPAIDMAEENNSFRGCRRQLDFCSVSDFCFCWTV